MVNLFNPVLKFLFLTNNGHEFKKYGFNSCRQTAIIGAYFLKTLLPEYKVKAYEGNFTEITNGIKEDYEHAFIIAKLNNRELLVDLSRTTKRLLFHPVFENVYPNYDDYKDVIFHDAIELDVDALINMEEQEYYTHMKPLELVYLIKTLMKDLSYADEEKQNTFRDVAYETTTQILRR